MTFMQEIAITGIGVVCPIGIGKEAYWAALCAGRSGVRRLEQYGSDSGLGFPFGGQLADFDPKQYVRPRKNLKVMSRDIQLAAAAADMACADGGLREHAIAPERLGVVFGADMINPEIEEMINVYRDCTVDGRFDYSRWGAAAMAEIFPLWMLKYLPNMLACHIGIAQDARGPSNSVVQGEVSSLAAVAEGVRIIQRGQADAVIAGGGGSRLHPTTMVRAAVLPSSHGGDDPAAACRPFDARRDGMVYGEGAAAVLLESPAHAAARGARSRRASWLVPPRSSPTAANRPSKATPSAAPSWPRWPRRAWRPRPSDTSTPMAPAPATTTRSRPKPSGPRWGTRP